jgi:hypothetical protein
VPVFSGAADQARAARFRQSVRLNVEDAKQRGASRLWSHGALSTVKTVRLLVIGIACAGKTTVARRLRTCSTLNVVDLDDEIMRCNGGTWPDIPTKNAVVLPKALAEIRTMPDVVLFGNVAVERTQELRRTGFSTALLDVSATELRRRHAVRLAEEGWTNVEWFDHEQEVIRDLRVHDVFDHVIDGQRTVAEIANDIMEMAEDVQQS